MSADQLFELDTPVPEVDPAAGMTAQRRLTLRQAQRLTQGLHPLSLMFGYIPLHTKAAPAGDRKADGLRCGTCQFRVRSMYGYRKCVFGDGVRTSHSTGSDCRAWWPACTDYAPAGDQE